MLRQIVQNDAGPVGDSEKFVIWGNDYDTPDGTCICDFINLVDLASEHS